AGCHGQGHGSGQGAAPAAGGQAVQPSVDPADEAAVVKDVQDTADEIAKNQQDCAAVKAGFAKLSKKLGAAARRVKNPRGKARLKDIEAKIGPVVGRCE